MKITGWRSQTMVQRYAASTATALAVGATALGGTACFAKLWAMQRRRWPS